MSELGTAGFFGKLPSRGDFLSRRLPRDFIDSWDGWLQQALATSRSQLAGDWLDAYLTSPVWCFALSSDVCGRGAYAGVMVPSVDRVGRYFPFVVAKQHAGTDSTLLAARELESWYARTHDLLLQAFDEPPLDVEELEAGLTAVSAQAHSDFGDTVWSLSPERLEAPKCLHFAAPPGADIAAYRTTVLARAPTRDLGAHGVWWTAGSERIEACVLVTSGLPDPGSFVAMLDGNWSRHGWQSVSLGAEADQASEPTTRVAAVSDRGKTRDVNEDAFGVNDDAGTWIVADGLGGHRAGDVASRMVASVTAHVSARTDLTSKVTRLIESLEVVNGCLRVLGAREEHELVASTLCALVLGGQDAGLVWSGDSRIYRLRDGQLSLLTSDHSTAVAQGTAGDSEPRADHTITRAVGGSDSLEVDVVYEPVLAGDRYLLCTDGLYAEVTREAMIRALESDDPNAACEELRDLVLEGSAMDNLTALIVHIENAR